MKIGIHLSTLTTEWSEDVLKYIGFVRNIGYEGVEFPLIDPDNFDFKRAKKLLKDHNMKCTCGTGLTRKKDISSKNFEIRKRGIEHIKKCIDLCNFLESDVLGGVLYAPWGETKPRKDAEENIKLSIEALRYLGEYARKRGVFLAVEILNRYETYFVNTVEEGKELLKKIGSGNVKLHFDTFHGNIEEKNLEKAIKLGGEDIYHVHFSENNRGIPGSGQIDWTSIITALRDINYDRWITMECFVMPNCEVGNGTFTWRCIEEGGKEAAKRGYDFIYKLLKEDRR